jgi:hypothetical protein
MGKGRKKNGPAGKQVTRYTHEDVKEVQAPETGHTGLLPTEERVITVPLDNGWAQAVQVGTASVFLDADGFCWLQFECLRGPKADEPGYPADPASKEFAASYRALFRAFAAESKRAEED